MASGAVIAQKSHVHVFTYSFSLSNVASPGDCQAYPVRRAPLTVAQGCRVLCKKLTVQNSVVIQRRHIEEDLRHFPGISSETKPSLLFFFFF